MNKYYFKKFDFRGFIDFVLELVDRNSLGQIRFHPEHKEFFDETQLTHIAPGRNINNPSGFVWAWIRKQDKVRKISFEQFSNDERLKYSMTIDLDKKSIFLEKAQGISIVRIEEALKNNIQNIIDHKKINSVVSLLRENIRKVIVGLIITVLGGLILSLII